MLHCCWNNCLEIATWLGWVRASCLQPLWVTACSMGPYSLSLCSQRVSAGPGRRAHPPAAAAAAIGAGVLPATSPTRPRPRRHCPLTASSLSEAPRHLTMALMRLRPATCSSMSPFPGRERWVTRRVLHSRDWCLVTPETERPPHVLL